MEKDKRIFEWVFSRWYFWVIFIIMWYINRPRPIILFSQFLGSLIGTFIVWGTIFIIIRFIFVKIKNR